MPKFRAFLKYWLPPLAWMALIFTGSSDAKSYQHSSLFVEPLLHWVFPHMTQEHIEQIHHLIRKCAHLAEYAVLALLLWRALRKPVKADPRPWTWPDARLALLMDMCYAATDEIHQSFVPTRTPLVTDVLVDTSGGAVALLAAWISSRWRKRR